VLGRYRGTHLRHDGPEHVLCFAPTRSDKGVGLVVPSLLTWPGSAIVHDIKGENWMLTTGFGPGTAACCCSIRPTAHRRPIIRSSRSAEGSGRCDVQNVADILVIVPLAVCGLIAPAFPALGGQLLAVPGRITVRGVLSVTAKYYGMLPDELMSDRRTQPLVRPTVRRIFRPRHSSHVTAPPRLYGFGVDVDLVFSAVPLYARPTRPQSCRRQHFKSRSSRGVTMTARSEKIGDRHSGQKFRSTD
jgi:hypothetical protein